MPSPYAFLIYGNTDIEKDISSWADNLKIYRLLIDYLIRKYPDICVNEKELREDS